ncbi:MAG: hypothetical protein IH614_03965 [Desulfuromonadales bacterium]|nr:hypothetical protein [Desulfuromonadales bacterium]
MNPFHTEILPNGLAVEFFDHSNRYFGDYWHLDLEVRCRVPLTAAGLEAAALVAARQLLGEAVDYLRRMEKMGVATADVSSNRDLLVEGFLASARLYLCHPSFPGRFVHRRLEEAQQSKRPYLAR